MSVLVKSDVTISSGARSTALSTNPGDRSVLIVEDNPFVARQCRSALLAAGFKVIGVVTTADDAIQVALERRPRLILMDIYLLGERDGVDAAIEIFQHCGIRSIFASTPADAAGKARAEAAQPLAWLPKPFSDKRLVATVAAAIVAVNANLQLPIPAWSAPKSGTRDGSSEAQASGDLAPELHDIVARMVAGKSTVPVPGVSMVSGVARGDRRCARRRPYAACGRAQSSWRRSVFAPRECGRCERQHPLSRYWAQQTFARLPQLDDNRERQLEPDRDSNEANLARLTPKL